MLPGKNAPYLGTEEIRNAKTFSSCIAPLLEESLPLAFLTSLITNDDFDICFPQAIESRGFEA